MAFGSVCIFFISGAMLVMVAGQLEARLPLGPNSFLFVQRSKTTIPRGRYATLEDVTFRVYGNSSKPTSYRLRNARRLLHDPHMDLTRRTVIYAHGYVELVEDPSVQTVVRAYRRRSDVNVVALDWANLAFGNYVTVALDVHPVGVATGKAVEQLIRGGLPLSKLHFVGHSLGAHVLATAARRLAQNGYIVPRLTGLDPAYPGFYPSLLGAPMSARDAEFVDVVHTDGGGYGAPTRTGHADFWPNGGRAKQPGCLAGTILFTTEDFCSHWRSWGFWAESVGGGRFIARACSDHDAFLRGDCTSTADMGDTTDNSLRGNFYLRTAARAPFALGDRGAA